MSLFPSHAVQCGPLKRRKYPQTVVGTPNIFWGYRIHERGDCKVVKLPKTYEHHDEEKQREYAQLLKTMDFEKHTNRRIGRKKLWQHVQQGMIEYEGTVNERREKLRELLLREQMSLTREVVNQAQHGDDARMDEMRERREQLRKKQEEQRLAVVAAKRMQQYLAQCPEIRDKIAKKVTVETKMSNLAQMADNEAKKNAEKELEDLWHCMMLKDVEARKEREIEDARNRCLAEQTNLTTITKQIAGKLALEEQKKQVEMEDREYVQQMLEELRQEDLRNQEKKRRERDELKKDLQEQVLMAKRRLAERARQEFEMDQLRQTLAEEELAKEKSKIKQSSATLRQELLTYLQHLEDLRKEEARTNMEADRVVEQWMKDASARRDLAVKRFKDAREKNLREVLKAREEQLKMKREKEKEEMEQRELEKEALKKGMELEAKLEANVKQEAKNKMLHYRKELEEQQRQIDEARRKEMEEEELMRAEELKQRQEYEKLTEELLHASENITPHPFKILLRECAERYAAEKEGRCYCPPPLSEE